LQNIPKQDILMQEDEIRGKRPFFAGDGAR